MAPGRFLQLAPDAAPPRVLVVDDLESNRTLLVRLLVPTGFDVREADDGLEAVEISEAWLPHLVLMDLQMPLLDGFSATRMIKQAAWGMKIVVIIISGDTATSNVTDALACGAIAFIPKPFVDAEILAALGSALSLTYS